MIASNPARKSRDVNRAARRQRQRARAKYAKADALEFQAPSNTEVILPAVPNAKVNSLCMLSLLTAFRDFLQDTYNSDSGIWVISVISTGQSLLHVPPGGELKPWNKSQFSAIALAISAPK